MPISLLDRIPDFECSATSDKTVTQQDLTNGYTVLYFYPRDNTPGCTTEGQDFSERHAEFAQYHCQIFGISKDSLRKHENFKAKFNFPFELICDENEILCQIFDVIKLKKNYGKEYLGIERSTFLISPEGTLLHEWRKVKVKEHAEEVLTTLKHTIKEATPHD